MKKLFSCILAVLILGLLFNNSVNWHYHQLPNGNVVEHAHPYAKFPGSDLPFQKHQHSDIEYLILDMVYYSGLIVILILAGILLLPEQYRVIRLTKPFPLYDRLDLTLPSLRAPPSINPL
jgi:hypothetical protein